MAVSNLFKLAGLKIGLTVLGGIKSWTDNINSEIINDQMTGVVYPKFTGIRGQKPTVDITTLQIATALGLVPIGGSNIDPLVGGVVCYLQKAKKGGSREATGHLIQTINDGMLIPVSINADHGGDVEFAFQAAVGFDGTNEPIIPGTGALPADTDNERFALGPVTLESVALAGVMSVRISYGITVVQDSADGDVWPTFVFIDTANPTVQITCKDASVFAAAGIPLTGKAATHANTVIQFRKRAKGGAFEADGAFAHIKITTAGLAHVVNANDGDGNVTLQVDCHDDGTNAPLVITTGVAIT